MRRDRFAAAGLLLGWLLAPSKGALAAESNLPAALDAAVAAAETSLRQGQIQAAQGHYREALFDGWLLVGSLERLENRIPEARVALRRASLFASDQPAVSRALALAFIQAGQPDEAVAALRGLAQRDPGDVEAARLLAAALAGAGRREQAIAALDAVSAKASEDPEQAFLLGNQYLWLRQLDSAERLFAKVFAKRPIPQTRVLIGRTYRDAGEYARARRELTAALALDPKVRRAHYYLGMITLAEDMSAERIGRAEAEFREELKTAPDDALTNDQLGLLLLDADRPAEALPVLQTAVSGEARAVYLAHLGRAQLALDRPREAADSLRRALEAAAQQGTSGEDLESIHFQLGRALRALGQEPEAKRELSEAARLAALRRTAANQAEADAARKTDSRRSFEASAFASLTPQQRRELRRHVDASLARAYFNLGVIQAQDASVPAVDRFARAAESLEKAAEIDPGFPQVQASLGIAHFNARQFAEATGPLQRALAASPGDKNLKRMLATAWVDTQVWDKAAALLHDDPDLAGDPTLQFAQGLALLRCGRAAEAESVLATLRERKGEDPALLALLGETRLTLGHYAPAIENLERALELKPDVPDANAFLGRAYWKLGRLDRAEAALRAALSTRPADLQATLTLAQVLEEEKKGDQAVAVLRQLLAKDAQAGEARLQLGRILLTSGRDAEAVESLEAAARLLPEEPRAHALLAEAYGRLGRKADAERELAASRTLGGKRGEDQ